MTEVPTFPFVVGGLDVATDRVEGPLIDLVTRHDDEEKAKTPAERKRDQRERDAAAGVVELKVRVGPAEAAQLAEALIFRASGAEPYTATEYILTLIRRDADLIKQQRKVAESKICAHCRKPMPRGCGGVWAGELPCALPQLKWALAL
ncbi:hypothetical protein FGA82_17820 [Pseudomonas fluorescens]|uniref:hypothetical protein n=1 Tax=Pseudomonas fluorescens TaxID=294 RepID=UPI00113196A4|nr:hypothetical protein [Pseudomonas fluorescens]TMU77481.1 hypothetical protein FGA82_17820 [Pseudomonas fluorescens]